MLLPLPFARPVRFPVEPGDRCVVRVFFTNDRGERCCIDSRVLRKTVAIRLATRVAQNGDDCEVLAWRHNCCRPPDWRVHRVKNLADAPILIVEAFAEDKPNHLDAREQTALW